MKTNWLYPIFLCVLTGCSSFLEGDEPLPLYTLKSQPMTAVSGMTVPVTVEMPLTDLSLDTARIAITPSPYQRDYVADGQWPDNLPQVFQTVLMDSLTQRWGGAWVNRSGTGLNTERLLQTEIQDFSVYNVGCTSPYVQIKVLFKLVDFPNRRVIASQAFCEKVPLTSSTLYGIVEAFNRGTNTLVGKAMSWMEGKLK